MILLISSFGPSNVTGKSCRLVQLVMETLHTNLSQLLLGTLILLISIFLIEQGLLTEADLKGVDFGQDPTQVDYAKVFEQRRPLLEKAVANFLKSSDQKNSKNFVKPMLLGWSSSQNTWLLKNTLI